jgi:pilus assembly protein CpaF
VTEEMSLLKRLERRNAPGATPVEQEKIPVRSGEEYRDKYGDLKIRIHKEIIESLDKELKQTSGFSDKEISKKVEEVINNSLERDASFLPYSERQKISLELLTVPDCGRTFFQKRIFSCTFPLNLFDIRYH